MLDVYGAREDPEPGVSGALVADGVPLPARARALRAALGRGARGGRGHGALRRPRDHHGRGRRHGARARDPRWSCRDDPLGARPVRSGGRRRCYRRRRARRGVGRPCFCCSARWRSSCASCSYDSRLLDVQGVQVEGISTLAGDRHRRRRGGAHRRPAGLDRHRRTSRAGSRRCPPSPPRSVDAVAGRTRSTVTVVERTPVASAATPPGCSSSTRAASSTPAHRRPACRGWCSAPSGRTTRPPLGARRARHPAAADPVAGAHRRRHRGGLRRTRPGDVGLTGNRQVVWGTEDRAAEKAAVLVPLLTQPGTCTTSPARICPPSAGKPVGHLLAARRA